MVGVAGFEPATPTSRTSWAFKKLNDYWRDEQRSTPFVHVWLRSTCRAPVGQPVGQNGRHSPRFAGDQDGRSNSLRSLAASWFSARATSSPSIAAKAFNSFSKWALSQASQDACSCAVIVLSVARAGSAGGS